MDRLVVSTKTSFVNLDMEVTLATPSYQTLKPSRNRTSHRIIFHTRTHTHTHTYPHHKRKYGLLHAMYNMFYDEAMHNNKSYLNTLDFKL